MNEEPVKTNPMNTMNPANDSRRVLGYYAVSAADRQAQRRSRHPFVYVAIADGLMGLVLVALITGRYLETHQLQLWGTLCWASLGFFLAGIYRLIVNWIADRRQPMSGRWRVAAVWGLVLWLVLFAVFFFEFASDG